MMNFLCSFISIYYSVLLGFRDWLGISLILTLVLIVDLFSYRSNWRHIGVNGFSFKSIFNPGLLCLN